MKKTNFKFFILALILVLSSFNHLFAYKLPPMPDDTEYNQFLKNQKDKAIYLAINTDINCFNDWCYIKGLMGGAIYPHKLGIYLGKIVFKKNKQGYLAPKYIPTSIENLEQELEKINPLWLDELNKDYVKLVPSNSSLRYDISLDEYKPNNIKTLCKKSKHNITLTKEQALSYIREIHAQNTQIIQAYIDEILKNYGLKPYVFTDEFYDELGELGIITQRQVKGFKKNRLIQEDELKLTMLDFLAKQNRKNEDYIITFDDELFYAYLVWSLEEYVLNLAQGMLQDNISLLFNPAAYIDDTKFNYREMYDQVGKKWNEFKTLEAFKIITTKYDDPNSGFFSIFHENVQSYFPTDGIGLYAYGYTRNGTEYEIVLNKNEIAFKSPNTTRCNENEHSYRYEYIKHNNKTIFEPVLNLTINHGAFKLTPSPLGKYYFELTYQEGIYLELIQPYYPTNPPKAWTKEMMKKLDLKLE